MYLVARVGIFRIWYHCHKACSLPALFLIQQLVLQASVFFIMEFNLFVPCALSLIKHDIEVHCIYVSCNEHALLIIFVL